MNSMLEPALSALDAKDKQLVARLSNATVLKAQEMPGVTAPLGFWDPVGFAADAPAGQLLFFREVELKHGRVGMLASLGLLVAEKFHPLFGGNIDVPSYRAFQETPLQTFWFVVLLVIGIFEIPSLQTFDWQQPTSKWTMSGDRTPGDLGF